MAPWKKVPFYMRKSACRWRIVENENAMKMQLYFEVM